MPGAHTLARINTCLDLLMPILYSCVATSYGAMHCTGACAKPDDIFSVALTPLFELPPRGFLLSSRDIRGYLSPSSPFIFSHEPFQLVRDIRTNRTSSLYQAIAISLPLTTVWLLIRDRRLRSCREIILSAGRDCGIGVEIRLW